MNILQSLLAPLKRFWQDLPTVNEEGYLVYSDNSIAMFMGVNKDANESGEVATAPIEVKEHDNDEKPEEVAGVLTPVELPRSRRDGKTPRRSAVGD